jgi:hypothetical protein
VFNPQRDELRPQIQIVVAKGACVDSGCRVEPIPGVKLVRFGVVAQQFIKHRPDQIIAGR